MKKLGNMQNKIYPILFFVVMIFLWQVICITEIVPRFMLPSPLDVWEALAEDYKILWDNLLISLTEAGLGMFFALLGGFIGAVLMDRFKIVHDIFYPVCIISQTVPTIAIAPLLVLWFGFGITPKVIVIFITCFFPILVGIVAGFDSVDKNVVRLYKSMNASYIKILFDVKIPYALESFFAGLKIAAAYSVVGAVIAEWLGGEGGLGVYMTRVRSSFRFDKMFAVIMVISIFSLLLMKTVEIIKDKAMPWKGKEK